AVREAAGDGGDRERREDLPGGARSAGGERHPGAGCGRVGSAPREAGETMPEEIVMPRLSDTMTEGTIARWLKKEGDPVKTGEALFEVETDKATLELQSYHDGTLVKILMADGSTAPIGTPVGILAKAGESVDAAQYAAPAEAKPSEASRGAAPDPGRGA